MFSSQGPLNLGEVFPMFSPPQGPHVIFNLDRDSESLSVLYMLVSFRS